MTAACVRWKTDTPRRPGRPPKDEPKSQFTRYGTVRVEPSGEVKDPNEGFARHYGDEALERVCRVCREGVEQDGVRLLRRVQGIDGAWRCGIAYQDGAQTIYVSAEVKAEDVALSRFGVDPAFAAWSDQRTLYRFAPGTDILTLPKDVRDHLAKKWGYLKQKHAGVEAEMNAAMALSPNVNTLRPFLDYARRRGLKIVTDTVSLK